MPWIARLLIGLMPKDNNLITLLVVIFSPLFFVGMLFAGPMVIHETVPIATPSQVKFYYDAAKEVSEGTKSPCNPGVTVNWQHLMAIDAVRLKQDFKKSSLSRARQLAVKFIQRTNT